ncbi:MAG TPA: DUF1501 domain-containing protein, partial [Caulifigura sp.]|nr:DUF1501 domain-containing protein [Caulifigura sp.]
RSFLSTAGIGFGAAALTSLIARDSQAHAPGRSGLPHFPAKIKRVIYLSMSGGPSQFETFDYKPEAERLDGQPMPESFTKGQPIAQLQGKELKVQGPMTKFKQYGESGQWISDFLPWHQKMADDICVIRSMQTEQINHDPANTFINTGTAISGRPSMGAWINYGLGSDCDDLPGFVVMTSVGGRNPQPIAARQWDAGFLPSRFSGVEFNSAGDPVHYISNPPGVTAAQQRRLVDAINALDRRRNETVTNPELETRIANYETAFKMQASVPELMDMSGEPQHILDMYGAKPGDGSFASNCLLARKLAERGVRFIQLYHRGWDHHDGIVKYMGICSKLTDQPAYALVHDLKQRGMLDETLVIWGGEFGRTPMSQANKGAPGRDHHMRCFTSWMAGGGIKGGLSYGQSDILGYYPAENPVQVRDMHATMLHLFGIDHERFTIKHQGLDLKLTGVEKAKILKDIFA